MLDRAPKRSPAWVIDGRWALEVLERQLGKSWPAQVMARSAPGSADWLLWSSSHVVAYVKVLELALGLQLVHGLRGHAKLRRAIAASVGRTSRGGTLDDSVLRHGIPRGSRSEDLQPVAG